ncbi:MAG: family 20 glycosylhydrolase, partial [Armatimonadota bacterium]|nr:family 20 glycosylhydrolase [Armatimonadota bacterium]
RYRLNHLILEVNYGYRYRSHPEVAEGDALTKEDCRELAALARKRFVRLVPMINCLGHQSWARRTAQFLRAHPEFDETPDLPPDNPGIYCRSWCPSHPDINRVVYALFDELIDAFRADAFHVGMDEVFILGECPRCKGKPNAELFAKAVNDYHRHLVGKRKVEMMLWGDRLLDSAATGYGKWEASENGTAAAIDLIPKDVIVCDWHYGVRDEYPSVPYFQEKGFRVWPAGWNSARNAQALAGCALRHHGERMMGYLATTWMGPDRTVAALAGDEKVLAEVKNAAGVAEAVRAGMALAWEGLVSP